VVEVEVLEARVIPPPGVPEVGALGVAGAGRLVDTLRRVDVGGQPVGVALRDGIVVGPGLASVRAPHDAAHLDPH
jgi:hypothetical protein